MIKNIIIVVLIVALMYYYKQYKQLKPASSGKVPSDDHLATKIASAATSTKSGVTPQQKAAVKDSVASNLSNLSDTEKQYANELADWMNANVPSSVSNSDYVKNYTQKVSDLANKYNLPDPKSLFSKLGLGSTSGQ